MSLKSIVDPLKGRQRTSVTPGVISEGFLQLILMPCNKNENGKEVLVSVQPKLSTKKQGYKLIQEISLRE